MGTGHLIWWFRRCFERAHGAVRFLLLCLAACLVAACARPLTPAETAFAQDLFGPTLNTAKVRILSAPYGAKDVDEPRVMRGTERACVRRPQPRGAQPPQAFALGNVVHFSGPLQARDMTLAWPKALRFPQGLIFAHELTHVWQWQNRAWTGYSPFRAVAEGIALPDPYFSASGEAPVFFAFGFEQQAAMVEDYVCFTIANPTHPRRAALRQLLEPVFPVDAFDAAIDRRGLLPDS
jgi:hypothetical protein